MFVLVTINFVFFCC